MSLCLFVIKSFQILISSHSLLFVSPSFRPLVTKSLRLLISPLSHLLTFSFSHLLIFSPSHFPFSLLYLTSSLTAHLSSLISHLSSLTPHLSPLTSHPLPPPHSCHRIYRVRNLPRLKIRVHLCKTLICSIKRVILPIDFRFKSLLICKHIRGITDISF